MTLFIVCTYIRTQLSTAILEESHEVAKDVQNTDPGNV